MFHLQTPHKHIPSSTFFGYIREAATALGKSTLSELPLAEWKALLEQNVAAQEDATSDEESLILARLLAGLPAFEEYLRAPFVFSSQHLFHAMTSASEGRSSEKAAPDCPVVDLQFVKRVLSHVV